MYKLNKNSAIYNSDKWQHIMLDYIIGLFVLENSSFTVYA